MFRIDKKIAYNNSEIDEIKEKEKSIMLQEFPPKFPNGLNSYVNRRNHNFDSTSKEAKKKKMILWKLSDSIMSIKF